MAVKGLDALVSEGAELLDGDEAVNTHQDFGYWIKHVREWLKESYPDSGLSAQWMGLGSSLLVSARGYSNDESTWIHFKSIVEQRMNWLGKLATEIAKTRASKSSKIQEEFREGKRNESENQDQMPVSSKVNTEAVSYSKTQMYYQVIADIKNGALYVPGSDGRNLYQYDINELAEIEVCIIVPYIKNQTFIIDGFELSKDMVDRLTILQSPNDINENIKLEREKDPLVVRTYPDILWNKKYYTNITNKIYSSVQNIIESEAQITLRDNNLIPLELKQSIDKYRKAYPVKQKTAFIMMQFSKSKLHDQIVRTIKQVLNKHLIIGLRADDIEFADDLFLNIRTYMHCSDFGIAVFERILEDEFNPNVSLEVGYMMGSGKNICFLKDQTLHSLQSDLIGKLYKSFDPQNISDTMSVQIEKWLKDKCII